MSKTPIVYLAGAIENAPEGGRPWRQQIGAFLTNELGLGVFDPTREENQLLTPEEFRNFRRWKAADLPRFRKAIHKIITNDLGTLTRRIDFIICYWDEFVQFGGGTQGELTMAYWHGIPVYLVTEIPIENISSWIVGCSTEIFQDFNALQEFLKERFKKNAQEA
jgi:hypothetical protein